MQADFRRALSGYDSFHGTNYSHVAAAQSRRRAEHARQLPAPAHRGWQEDRAGHRFRRDHRARRATSPACRPRIATALVILKRWAQNPAFLQRRRHHLPDRREPDRAEPGTGAESRRRRRSRFRCPMRRAARVHSRATGRLAAAGRIGRYRRDCSPNSAPGLKRVQLQSLISQAGAEPAAAHDEVPVAAQEGADRSRIRRTCSSSCRAASTCRWWPATRPPRTKLQDAAAAIRAGTHRRGADGLRDLRSGGHGQDVPDHVLRRRDRHSRRDAEEFPQHVAGRHRRQPGTRAEPAARP